MFEDIQTSTMEIYLRLGITGADRETMELLWICYRTIRDISMKTRQLPILSIERPGDRWNNYSGRYIFLNNYQYFVKCQHDLPPTRFLDRIGATNGKGSCLSLRLKNFPTKPKIRREKSPFFEEQCPVAPIQSHGQSREASRDRPAGFRGVRGPVPVL